MGTSTTYDGGIDSTLCPKLGTVPMGYKRIVQATFWAFGAGRVHEFDLNLRTLIGFQTPMRLSEMQEEEQLF